VVRNRIDAAIRLQVSHHRPTGEGLSHEARTPRHFGPRALSVSSHRNPRRPARILRSAFSRVVTGKIVPPFGDCPRKYRGEPEPVGGTCRVGAGHQWCHLVSHVPRLPRSRFNHVLRQSRKWSRLVLRRRQRFGRNDMRAPNPSFRQHDHGYLQRSHHPLPRQRSWAFQEGPCDRCVNDRGARARHERRRRGARLAGIEARFARTLRSPKRRCTQLAWKIPDCEPHHSSGVMPGLYEGRAGLQGCEPWVHNWIFSPP